MDLNEVIHAINEETNRIIGLPNCYATVQFKREKVEGQLYDHYVVITWGRRTLAASSRGHCGPILAANEVLGQLKLIEKL